MKKLFFSLFTCFVSFVIPAQTVKDKKYIPDSAYCLIVKGQTQVLTQSGVEIKEDVKLTNGDRISVEGRLRRTDGTEIKLKEGECIDKNGLLIKAR